MSSDSMDIDKRDLPNGVSEPEKKRKSKSKDPSSPTKKRKHHSDDTTTTTTTTAQDKKSKSSKEEKKEKKKKNKDKHGDEPAATTTPTTTTTTTTNSPFTLTTATLYLPLSPISISPTHALASLLAEHLSPLLLTYYPPLKGVILSYSNASISEKPPPHNPQTPNQHQQEQPLTLATTANEYGVLYVYLTATFLVFRPQRGQTLEGLVNVQSDGFLGAVVFNLFSVGIERKRLPTDWKWVPPGEGGDGGEEVNGGGAGRKKTTFPEDEDSSSFDPEKEHFTPTTISPKAQTQNQTQNQNQNQNATDPTENQAEPEPEAEESNTTGYFQSPSGHRVHGTVRFRVVDIDVIPGSERDRGFISIEGSMLSPDEEESVVREERGGFVSSSAASLSSAAAAATPRREEGNPAQGGSGAGQSVSQESEKSGEKEKSSKSKSKSKKKDKEKEKEAK